MANYTPNYQLHQWEPDDPFLRTDFNEDLQKIDTALNDLAQDTQELESMASKYGNCDICTEVYVGSGRYGESSPTQLTFSAKPWCILITDLNTGLIMVAINGQPTSWARQNGAAWNNFTWSGNTVSWWSDAAENQMNDTGVKYQVVAFMIA